MTLDRRTTPPRIMQAFNDWLARFTVWRWRWFGKPDWDPQGLGPDERTGT